MRGADEESTREAFAFRWRAPATAQSLDLAARAAPHLQGEWRGEEPSVVLLRAMRDTSIDPSTRVWMVLDAFARSAPPDERMDGWLSDTDPRYVVTGRRGEGLTLEAVLELWRLRAQHLASLVEARYLAGAPTTAPRSQVNLQTRTPDRPARDRRTVTALHFAATQLDQKQQRRARSAALQPDVGATVLLELSLGASFAFWSTAGLLAGLSRRSA